MRYGHLIAVILFVLCAAVFALLFVTRPLSGRIGVAAPRPNPGGQAATATTSAGLFYTEPQSSEIRNVMYTDKGFTPLALTVPAGTTVVFQNRSSQPFWPASTSTAIYPDYPAKGSCGATAFNACSALPTNMSWAFKFDTIGIWAYDDILNTGHTGVIIVK